jgi:hypothetical protein
MMMCSKAIFAVGGSFGGLAAFRGIMQSCSPDESRFRPLSLVELQSSLASRLLVEQPLIVETEEQD